MVRRVVCTSVHVCTCTTLPSKQYACLAHEDTNATNVDFPFTAVDKGIILMKMKAWS